MKIVPMAFKYGTSAHLDVSDIPELANNPAIAQYCIFSIKTYTKLHKGHLASAWKATFGPINDFFEEQDKETNTAIAMALLTMHQRMIELSGNITSEFENIGHILVQLNNEIRLCDRLKQYALKHLPIGTFAKAGTRAQDRPEMTFHRQEIEDLAAIILLCKMLCPLFGTAMNLLISTQDLDTKLKETYTAKLLNPIFQSQYPIFIEKLDGYIYNTITSTFQENTTTAFNGTTLGSLNVRIRSGIFVRSLVNVDFYYNDGRGNLMTYICSVTRNSVDTYRLDASNKSSFMHRDPTKFGDSDESTVTQTEVDSVLSDTSFDITAIASTYLPKVVERTLVHYDLDSNLFSEMRTFYDTHPYPLTKLNRALVFGFFGAQFDGARNIQLLYSKEFNQLIALIQILAFSNNWAILGHLLTATRGIAAKTLSTDDEIFANANYGNSHSFSNCRGMFQSSGAKWWEEGMKAIALEIVSYDWVFNAAPCLWDMADLPNMNGKVITIPKTITEEISRFTELYILQNVD